MATLIDLPKEVLPNPIPQVKVKSLINSRQSRFRNQVLAITPWPGLEATGPRLAQGCSA